MQTFSDDIPAGVSFPLSNQPRISTKHIDGPVIFFRDGQMHWLTLAERLRIWLGMIDSYKLERELRPRLTEAVRAQAAVILRSNDSSLE